MGKRHSGYLVQNWLSEAIAKLKKEEQATLFKAGEIIKRMAEMS